MNSARVYISSFLGFNSVVLFGLALVLWHMRRFGPNCLRWSNYTVAYYGGDLCEKLEIHYRASLETIGLIALGGLLLLIAFVMYQIIEGKHERSREK